MSPLMYTILCIVCSIAIIGLVDYLYKSVISKWSEASSYTRMKDVEVNSAVAPLLVQTETVSSASSKDATDGGDIDLEAYAKCLLNGPKE